MRFEIRFFNRDERGKKPGSMFNVQPSTWTAVVIARSGEPGEGDAAIPVTAIASKAFNAGDAARPAVGASPGCAEENQKPRLLPPSLTPLDQLRRDKSHRCRFAMTIVELCSVPPSKDLSWLLKIINYFVKIITIKSMTKVMNRID